MIILRKPKPIAVGCHIYAGGFTLGLRDHFNVVAHLEEGDFGVDTVKKNLPKVGVFYPTEKWSGINCKPALLFGNPPCASWSIAGVKVNDKEERNDKRWSHDDRTDCTVRLFNLIPKLQPQLFIWESVAAAMKNGKEFVDERVKFVNGLGYHAHLILFNGRDCGLPQMRKRFFFLASRGGLKVHVTPPPLASAHAYTTVRGCLATVPASASQEGAVPNANYLKILQAMKPGEVSLQKTFMRLNEGKDLARNAHGGAIGRPGFLNQRLRWDELAPTITGGPQFFHPEKHRALTIKEQQVMCGYPLEYEFVGKTGDKYAQIAKAVLPPAARWIGGICAEALRSNQKDAGPVGSTLWDFLS